jgi:hypothetical protein
MLDLCIHSALVAALIGGRLHYRVNLEVADPPWNRATGFLERSRDTRTTIVLKYGLSS